MIKERILFIAVGQGAGNITKELNNLGYNSYYINTSYEDLRTLQVNDNVIYHIPNSKGCARSKTKALEYASNYFEEITAVIDSKFPTSDIIYVVYGGGGGTSSMANMLTHIMSAQNPSKTYNIIVALPSNKESILVHSNAIENLKELRILHKEQDNVKTLFFLDNNSREDFLEINTEFAMLFDRFVGYEGTTIRGNVDGEEIETIITDKGVSAILEFEDEDFKIGIAKSIEKTIFTTWNMDCNYVGAILNKNFTDINVSEELKESFGVPITDFKTFDDDTCNLVIGSGMSFNKSIISNLSDIAKERLAEKKRIQLEQEQEEDDDTSLDLTGFNKKTVSKKVAPKKNTKDLSDILSRYRNIK
jgi:cell division GTPase FtsZ